MATIPRIVAQRSLDPGGVVSYPQGDPVGQALEQAGTKGQSLVTHYFDRVAQQERFQSLISFDGFSNELVGETDKAKQTMKPGALGLHDQLLETYDKRSSEWLATIPEGQRPEFEARVRAKREQFSVGAARLEKDESDRFQVDGITKRLDTAKSGVLQTGPEAVAAYQKDVEELIDSSTLTPIAKQQAKDKVKADLAETGFLSLAKRDPEEAKRVAKGWGVDQGFSGTAVDRTMQLLRDKEGFKSSTYWDVNAERVGYGSDTITAADGTIRTVKRGDTVTRADAERDLQRRTAESLDSVRKSVGDEAFSRLNPNQQAALGSVTYNYGRLPDNIAAAARSGDAAAIAAAIEARQGDNNGVNKARRLSEAALARSSGDGPVQGVYQPDERFNGVPADKRLQLAGMADLEQHKRDVAVATAATQDYNNKLNTLQTAIIDNNATLADIQKARQDGWLKDAGDILKLQGQIAARDKGMADSVNFGKAIADPNFAWNPVDKDQRDWADAGFKSLGGNMQSLQTVAEKTGIVPASAGVALKGALFSPNAQTVQNALQTSANLVGGRYPDIFASVADGKQLTDAALTFRHYVYDRGMTAADATKRIMEERMPEYQQKVTAKIKSEDMREIVKKELKDSDIRGAFDDSLFGLAPNPKLAFSPEQRNRAMGDYEEIFREKFAANGDVALSKKLALEEFKKTWGVTQLNGSKVVMKFPPEKSAAYTGIENVSDGIAAQAVLAIKEFNGVDVERSKLRIEEIKNTADRYMRGEAPGYFLSYEDKNGNFQTIPREFYADPEAMRAVQTAAREKGAAFEQKRAEAMSHPYAFSNQVAAIARYFHDLPEKNRQAIKQMSGSAEASNAVP
jgi:GH24 family phage-related lysozyme (muramidase)